MMQEPLQLKEDAKFFTKLISKESSMANPSLRVYYGVASGAVPFMWESQPGTPKHKTLNPTLLPPLNPPPSHYHDLKITQKDTKKHSKNPRGIITSIFPRLSLRKPSQRSSVSLSASLSSSSSVYSISSFSSGSEAEESTDRAPISAACSFRSCVLGPRRTWN